MKSWLDKTNQNSLNIRTAGLGVACLIGIAAVGFGYQETLSRANVHKANSPAKPAVKLSSAEINQAVGKLPLAFEPNKGQASPRVQYIARANGYTALLAGDETVLLVKGAKSANGALAMKLLDANAAARIAPSDEQVGKSNYLVGNNRSKWLTNLPNYGKVRYEDVYRGIDVVFSGNQRNVEYDFVVKPGASPNQIRIAYQGTSRFALNAQGDLELETAAGRTLAHKPVVYQTIDGRRKPVDGAYVLTARNEVGFKIGAYDASQPLVIDPIVTVLTTIGGSAPDTGFGVAVNAVGVYMTGETFSAADYVAAGANATANANGFPITPITCTGTGAATAGSGCALGTAAMSSFPTLGAYNGAVNSGAGDAFVTKLDSTGSTLLFSTFLGGTGEDIGKAIALDAAGNAYVTGSTASANFPLTTGAFAGAGADTNMFYARVSAAGTSLSPSTFFGAAGGQTVGNGIAVDTAGNVYIGGSTNSNALAMSNPLAVTATTCTGNTSDCSSAFTGVTYGGGTSDGFIVKYNTSTNVAFSTYLGGLGADFINGLTLDSAANIYVAGTTGSLGGGSINAAGRFPTTKSGSSGTGTASNTLASTAGSGNVAFVTKINANLSVGFSDTVGNGAETASSITVDSSNRPYIAGNTNNAAGAVSSVTITNPGVGFTGGAVAFTGGIGAAGTATTGTTATATANLGTPATATPALGIQATGTAIITGGGGFGGANITNTGSGYTTGLVTATVTSFTGCSVAPVPGAVTVSNGAVTGVAADGTSGATGCTSINIAFTLPGITGVNLTTGGTGYSGTVTPTITGCTTNPTFTASTLTAGAAVSKSITALNLTGAPANGFGAGCGPATAVVIPLPGITGFTITNGGSSYGANPTVTITGGACAPVPTATSSTSLGRQVSAINLTATGAGCTSAPAVAIQAPGVGSIVITSGGAGYTAASTVAVGGVTGFSGIVNVSSGGGFSLTTTGATPQVGVVNGAPAIGVVGAQGYVLSLAASGATANYLTYLLTANAAGETGMNAIAVDDGSQAYVVGTQGNGITPTIVFARLNQPGAALTLGSPAAGPGGINFQTSLPVAGGATTGTGVAVLTTGSSRTAFVLGNSTLAATPSPQAGTPPAGVPPFTLITTSQQSFVTNGNLTGAANLSTIQLTGKGAGDLVFGAFKFQDVVPTPATVSFVNAPGSTTITVTGVGGAALPCALAAPAANQTGGFFGGGGTVTQVSSNTFTVSTGTLAIPAVAAPATGSFQIAGATGCIVEPVTIPVAFSSATAFSTSVAPSGSLTVTVPVGTAAANITAPNAVINITAAQPVNTTVVAAAPTNWASANSACPNPVTLVPTGNLGATPTATTLTYNTGCIASATVPGTYSGVVTISSTTPGQATTTTLNYSINITGAIQIFPIAPAPPPLNFNFATSASAATQQSVTFLANFPGSGSAPYSAAINPGTVPVGVLSIVGAATGSIPFQGTGAIVVAANPAGAAVGTYLGSLVITSGTSTLTVPLNVTIGGFSAFYSLQNNPATATPVSNTGITLAFPTNLGTTSAGTLMINGVNATGNNISNATITFTGTATGWLTIAGATGCNATVTLAATCANPLFVTTAGLAVGTYQASIGFTSTTGSALSVPVTLTVAPGPSFQQSLTNVVPPTTPSAVPTRLVFTAAPGLIPNPPALTSVTTCNGVSTALCTVSLSTNFTTVSNVSITPATNVGGSWLNVCVGAACAATTSTAITGTSLSTVGTNLGVTVNTTNLAPRTYTGTITVAGAGTSGPLVIPVSLVVLPQNPTGVGVFRGGFLWVEDANFNQVFDGADLITAFGGIAGDIPVVGDWSGTGTSKIGVYRNGQWLLDFNGNGTFDGAVIDRIYSLGGVAGDYPVVGDWNGGGFSKIGLFRAGFFWILDFNGNGQFDGTGAGQDVAFAFGGVTGCTQALPSTYSVISAAAPGVCDIPVVGDWNNSGTTKVGVVRASGASPNFLWILDTTGAQQFIAVGTGVTNASTIFAFGGIQGDLPLVGDWNNSGTAKVGVFRSGFFFVLDVNGDRQFTAIPPDAAFAYGGSAGDIPVVGRWR